MLDLAAYSFIIIPALGSLIEFFIKIYLTLCGVVVPLFAVE